MQNEIFSKFRKRLVAEGVLKACLLGLAVGGAVDFIIAFVTWFTPFNGLWLSLGLGIGAGVAAGIASYFIKFKPSTDDIARRVDRLGMDERMITMVELDGDDSYIARVQRANAESAAAAIPGKKIKIGASVVSIVLACVLGVAAGPAMTTVTALSAYGIIDSGSNVIDGIVEKDVFYEVEYIVDDECAVLIGDAIQVVKAGESAESINLDVNDGYVFDHWEDEDGNPVGTDPARSDTNITQNLALTAVFVETGEEGDGDGDGDGEGEGDEPAEPKDPTDNSNGNGSGLPPANGSNNIIDGETDYKTEIDAYYQMAMQYLTENGTLPDYLRKIVEAYFQIIS